MDQASAKTFHSMSADVHKTGILQPLFDETKVEDGSFQDAESVPKTGVVSLLADISKAATRAAQLQRSRATSLGSIIQRRTASDRVRYQ